MYSRKGENKMTYLVRIAYLGFEVNTEIQAHAGVTPEELLESALNKLEKVGFSCPQNKPTVFDMEFEEN